MKLRLFMTLSCLFLTIGMAFAQSKITGTVLFQDDGTPIYGAAVKVVDSQKGVATDVNGQFTIDVPEGTQLRISYIGMESKIVKASDKMIVSLIEEENSLDEVMIVAYGSQKKVAFTGAAASLDGKAIQNMQVSSLADALQGMAAGVQTVSASGSPGSSNTIIIRGIGSISANKEPLIVLDGVPYSGNLNSIPTQDIENVSILKDAAANSMYGARGANGVIIVTTKSAKSGKPKIEFNARYGFNARGIPNYDVITDAGEYMEMVYEAYRNSLVSTYGYAGANQYAAQNLVSNVTVYNPFLGVADNEIINPLTGKLNPLAKKLKWSDDWTEDPFENGSRQEYTFNVSGGSGDTKAYASIGYLNDEGYMVGSGFERYNGRIKLDQNIGEYITVGANLGYARTERTSHTNEASAAYSNIFMFTQAIAPIYPIFAYDNDGNVLRDPVTGEKLYDWGTTRPYGNNSNPYAQALESIDKTTTDNITSRAYFKADFLKYFNFTANLSYDVRNTRTEEFATPIGGDGLTYNGRAEHASYRYTDFNLQELLNYEQSFGEHTVSAMVGHENQKYTSQYIWGEMTNFALDNNYDFDAATKYQGLNGSRSETTREGYFLRGNYDYADRYYFNASIRRDGSSIFHKDNRWGTFWAVGASWRLKEESWLKDVDWLDNLKIKASYGTQGNDGIASALGYAYAYKDVYSVNRVNEEVGLSKVLRGNKDLTWEKSKNFNVGFEASLWNRLNVEFDFFIKETDDLLYYSPLAASEGTPSGIWRNEMDMKNTGVELTVDGTIIKTDDFRWTASLNLTHYKNELTRLPASKPASQYPDGYQAGSYWRKIGGSLYDWYLYEYAGVDEATGAPLYYGDVTHFYDLEGNEISGEQAAELGDGNYTEKVLKDKVDFVNATQYELGKSAIPDLTGGLSTTLSYKGFDLSISTAFQIGGYVQDSKYMQLMTASGAGQNYHKDMFNRWTPNNTKTDIPALYYGVQSQFIDGNSDFYITDASYFALRNVTLGYTLPRTLTHKWGINNLRVYVTGDNIWLHSARKGLDPRQSLDGATGYIYSALSSYSVGLNLTF